MATKREQLRALAAVCRRFGGYLKIVSEREFERLFDDGDSEETPWDEEELSASPFTSFHGVWWSKKIVYATRGYEEVGSIIHEMGHVFASPHHPHHTCPECSEWKWLGWEIALARHVNASRTWSRDNANYIIDSTNNLEWGSLSTAERRSVVADRLVQARKIGVLDDEGAPRSVRGT